MVPLVTAQEEPFYAWFQCQFTGEAVAWALSISNPRTMSQIEWTTMEVEVPWKEESDRSVPNSRCPVLDDQPSYSDAECRNEMARLLQLRQ